MPKRVWQAERPKLPPKPKVPDEIREMVDLKAAPVVAMLKRRYCKTPEVPRFNWPEDLFTRWHRDALYFVVVIRTPHGRPPTFEAHAARMEHVGGGKFNLAVPMRKGWNTFMNNATLEACLEEVSESISF
ncbi:MAG: hypothetical protein JWP89_2693 [Schlesneria sp.]|nr:hypothetical protein [Schlesneria sp.]